jgi:hypothetical protein
LSLLRQPHTLAGMRILPRVVVIAVVVAACGEDPASDDEGTSTGSADETTESSSTGQDFLECDSPLLEDIGLELTILPPFTPADDVGVQYSGACTVTTIDTSDPIVAVLDLACTGEGGPQADWAITARITWTGGTLPLSLAPMSAVDVAIAHAAIDGQLDSIAIHAEDELVFAASSGQMLALGGDQGLWAPLAVEAPADQMCAEEPDECSTSARNRLLFAGLTGTAIDVFDHHAVATDDYDILVGRALTPVGAECDGGGPGWYDFIVLRTGA